MKGERNLISVIWSSLQLKLISFRAVVKSHGPGIFPGYYKRGLQLLLNENRRKIKPKEILSCLIPCLLVVFPWQLEILVTTLFIYFKFISRRGDEILVYF